MRRWGWLVLASVAALAHPAGAQTNWPERPVVRGSRNASTLQPAMAISDRPMKNGVLR